MTRALQPDVAAVLDYAASLDLPALESLAPVDARAFQVATSANRPPGPEVGEMIDGELPGATGPLAYRLYRPATPGPHPLTAYFHGGGFVIGSQISDDPFCRQLCIESDSLIVSVDYRHAPEHRFPAAHDDGLAAVRWLTANREPLGASPASIAVAGWSAGGNIAATMAQHSRDSGEFGIAGQVLLTPLISPDERRPSHTDNAEGYGLTTSMLDWFVDNYTDEADRSNPRVSPLRASNLGGLAPALIITADFDPLRDEGAAYAAALTAAGNAVDHLACDGQTHTSIVAVDVIESAAPIRSHIAATLREFHT